LQLGIIIIILIIIIKKNSLVKGLDACLFMYGLYTRNIFQTIWIKKWKEKVKESKRICEITHKESNPMALSKPSSPFKVLAVSYTVALNMSSSSLHLLVQLPTVSCVHINKNKQAKNKLCPRNLYIYI